MQAPGAVSVVYARLQAPVYRSSIRLEVSARFDNGQQLALERQYDFILDKSEGITVIFADPKLDRSLDVLRNLGVK